jgi:hypothetical protein
MKSFVSAKEVIHHSLLDETSKDVINDSITNMPALGFSAQTQRIINNVLIDMLNGVTVTK